MSVIKKVADVTLSDMALVVTDPILNDVWDSVNHRLKTDVALDASDIEIGAVEIKNGADDTRATVKAASTAAVATDTAVVVALSPNNPVTVAGAQGVFTDRSGTVTLGGTAQQIAAANASRKYLAIQNVSDTDLWVNIGVAAVANQPSFRLLANGGSVTWEAGFIPTGLVSVIGATTGKAFTAKEA